jgi:hypothetical protein
MGHGVKLQEFLPLELNKTSIEHHVTTAFTPEEDLSLLSPTANLGTMVVYIAHLWFI